MAKKSKVVVLFILAVLLVTFSFPVSADDLDDALKQQQEILQKQNKAESNLKNLTNKAQQMQTQIKDLTQKITVAETDLSKKEHAFANAQEEVAYIQGEVEAKEAELTDRQETLRNRVRSIYEAGQVNYLEVLFQSTDLSDFITRVEYLSCLVENDQDILTDIRVQKHDLDQKKVQLVNKMNEAENLKQQAAAAKQYLDSTKAQKQIALAENKKDQAEILEQIEKLEADSKALEAKIRELQKNNKGKVTGTINTWPSYTRYITSNYGYRVHPVTGQYKLHTGVDIGASYGSKIMAAGAGTVIFSGWYGAYGNAVIIDHGNNMSTLYGHMSSRAVAAGATVSAGQVIGYVGSTGWSTGPHLHFEVRKNGVPTNPMAFF
ncbi:peptidoglycan DD-metalloendopeptidase family protein [Dehalobacter sp. DCM]|uniref:murein hydrolase activator EnvC family protein n=1 Tax=Dehalobacter sp. DCM TaxID=2907827 RepID=UPI00308171DF|nr:peptidoglycan DD-metalloendopeptidase family protein [Dehalobacter sp. DCM]